MSTESKHPLTMTTRTGAGLTRRGVLKAAGGAVASVPALASFSRRTAAQETPGGTLVAALVAEPTSLDPNQLTDIN